MRIIALFLSFLLASAAAAHDSRPLAVTVTEEGGGRFRVDWRAPPSVDAANSPFVGLGAPCVRLGGERAPSLQGRDLYACSAAPQEVSIAYQVFNPSLSTLVRTVWRSGETSTALLGPEQSSHRLDAPATFGAVAKSYFSLGVEHILIGVDHILFLLGLLILARTPARILVTVTGFTLAHSVTLVLVALDAMRVSIPAVEATIALSIVFVAAEIARGDRTSLAWRRPVIVATTFGLLHGAGFAAVLSEIGLPQTEKVAALLFFNVGVEAGQIMLVAGALAAALVWRTVRTHGIPRASISQPERFAGYGLGIVSGLWFVERTAAIFL